MIYVFLPAFNEEIALPRVVRKFDERLRAENEPHRFVVLDDGSRDRTCAIAEELAKDYPLDLLRHPSNLGLGMTLRDGVEHLAKVSKDEDVIVMLDCDDTHEPEFLPAALKKVREGHEVVLLSRFCPGGSQGGLSPVKKFLSMGACLFLKVFFPMKGVREYSCCYRVFRASILKKALRVFGKDFIRLPHMGFVATAEILIRMRMLNAKVIESPFILRYDQKPGRSKNRPLRTIAGYFALVALYFGRKV